ncbi:16512_t:CDS:2 [Entrophospora sp. SA101]|nr:16512_t:CDS:2 [Entrophospora sp. SA101]
MNNQLTIIEEPRLKSTKYFDYKCSPQTLGLHNFFIDEPASKWCLETFVNRVIKNKETELNFDQIQELFLTNLDQINNLKSTPQSVHSFCENYINWLQFFEETIEREKLVLQKRKQKEILEEYVSENAKFQAFESSMQLPRREKRKITSPPPRESTSDDEDVLLTTPNKKMLENEDVKLYVESIPIVCAFGVNIFKLKKLLGNDLANQISEYRDKTPSIWTKELENYLEYALDQTGKQFKMAIQNEIEGESANKFRERKFIVCHISALFKFYESTFGTLTFDWIESHSQAAKVTKSSTDTGIVKDEFSDSIFIFYSTKKELGIEMEMMSGTLVD